MVIAIIILLFASFFFSLSEAALKVAEKQQLKTKADNKDPKADKLLDFFSNPDGFFTAIVISNKIIHVVLLIAVTLFAMDSNWHIGIVAAVSIAVLIILDRVSESIAATSPERVSHFIYPVIRFIAVVFKPVIFLFNTVTHLMTKPFVKEKEAARPLKKPNFHMTEELADLEAASTSDLLERSRAILDFSTLSVKDVLKTPRVGITALPNTATYEEAREMVMQHSFTRYPVYEGDIDHIIGVFHSKYLIHWSLEPNRTLESFCDLEPFVVYEFHSIERVFHKITKERKHMVIVLDEYGGTEGILTHKDIIQALVDIRAEAEPDLEEEKFVESLSATEIVCDGKIPLERLNGIFGTEIPEEEDVLAAYLAKEFIDFPQAGEVLERNNLSFHVLEIDGRAIRKVLIKK